MYINCSQTTLINQAKSSDTLKHSLPNQSQDRLSNNHHHVIQLRSRLEKGKEDI